MLSKFEMRSILGHLNAATAELARTETAGFESTLAWRLRMVRERLLAAAIGDVEVETQPMRMLEAA